MADARSFQNWEIIADYWGDKSGTSPPAGEDLQASKVRSGDFFEDEVLVHIEHLLSVEVDGDQDGSNERDEERSAPGFGEGPEFEFVEVGGEKYKAKKNSNEY